MTKALSTEPPVAIPVFLIGGGCHGQAYLMSDRPRWLDAVAKREFPAVLFDDPAPFKVEHYSLREARVHGWDTPWLYYAHESLDEQAALLALWSFLWEGASRIARAGGWEPDKRCRRCSGTGVER